MKSFTRISLAFILALTLFVSKSFGQCSLTVTPAVTYTCTGNGSDGIITFTVSKAALPYSFNFNSGGAVSYTSSTVVESGLSASTGYSYVVTDANNCMVSGSVVVNSNKLPKAKVAPSTTICAGTSGSYALGANSLAGNTYSWTSSPTGFSSNSSDPSISYPYFTTTYTLTETNPNGCSASNSVSITVNYPPSVSIGATENSTCAQGDPITLSGSPSGGTFSGNSVSGNSFSPSSAGVGNWPITYFYSDPTTGCSNSATTYIDVTNVANLSLSTPYTSVCVDASNFKLTGTPGGGTYVGDGITDSTFDPTVAGPGTHVITYYYTQGTGCSYYTTVTIMVHALPVVKFPSNKLCLDNGVFALNGTPSGSGGIYSGTGVSGQNFNPLTAGVGSNIITFVYTDAYGCSSSTYDTITVLPIPSVSLTSSVSSICLNGNSFTLSGGSPSGGTYSGSGVSSGIFNPANAGAGTQTIGYTILGSNGCSNTATTNITVNPLPSISFGSKTVCIGTSSLTLSATPSGGTFSGSGLLGLLGNTLNLLTAGIGNHAITYTYTDGNGCTNSATATISIVAQPTVSISSIPAVCVNAGSVSLSNYGSPSGGTFSGTGVTNNVFNPASAGAGTYTLTYTYTDGNGCTSSATSSITVIAAPTVTMSSLPNICSNASTISLSSYGSPSGGTFSGTGVSSNVFNPATAGAGTFTITYTYSLSNGCSNSATGSITVNALPIVSISTLPSVCVNGSSINLSSYGSPSGGTFSGTGVSSNVFNPATAGAGTYTLTYTYTNSNGCTNSATANITVSTTPTVSVNSIPSVCTNSNAVSLSSYGSPSGGTFSGTGVSNNIFNPSTAGTYTLTYTYSNSNNCSNSSTGTITVNALPTVSVSSIPSVCVKGNTVSLSSYGSPSGGTFSGTGVSNNVFYPAVAGTGSFTLTYTYTNSSGCTNSATTTITVAGSPTASFSINDTEQCLSGNSFSFTDLSTTSSGTISSWAWNFGDNSTSSSQNPTHSYASSGTYNVTLTATSSNGCSVTTTVAAIVDPQPSASFTSKGSACLLNTNIAFSDASKVASGSIVGWAWNFGDGIGTSSLQNPNYIYNGTGSYTVTLTVTTDKGCTGTYSSSVTIYPSPAASFSSNVSSQCLSSTPISFTDGSISLAKISSWSWNFGNGAGSTSQSPSEVYTAGGTYSVTMVVTTVNGCTDTARGQVAILALPAANPGSAQTICAGSSVSLGSTPVTGSSYTWGNSPTGYSSADTTVTPSSTSSYTLTETNSNGCTASNSVTITVSGLPAANTGTAQSICSGSSATIGSSAVTGSKYTWVSDPSGFTSSSSLASVSPTVITTYTLTETNSNGCVASNSVIITVNPLPAAIAGSNQTISSGSSATIGGTAVPGSTYSWVSSPSGFTSSIANPTVSPTSTTTYTVTEINADGCKNSNSVKVTVTTGSQPTISVKGSTTFCAGGSVQLSTSNSQGYSFQWSNQNGNISGATSSNYYATASGTYYVTVTTWTWSWSSWSWTSSSSTSVGVTVNVIPAPAANAGSNQSICAGSSVTLGATAVQGSKYIWTISGPGHGPGSGNNTISTNSKITVSPTTNTTYVLTETNANGCTNSNSVTVTVVPLPKVGLPPFQNVCAGGSSFTLSGGNPSGGTYVVDGVSATSFNPANESLGNHTITYTYTNSTGCSGSASQTITVTSAQAAPTISANGSTSFCSGGSVALTASSYHVHGDVDYSWSNQNGPLMGPGSQSQSINVTNAGTYYVTVSINGCTAISTGTTVTISQAPVANAGSNVTYNYGYDNPPVLTGSANVSGATYLWSTGATTASITVYPTQTTTYWLTVTANGCTSKAAYVTVYVLDVHCYNMKDKNRNNECQMCHYDPTRKQWGQITVNKSDVPTHEKNGDNFGNCGNFGADVPGMETDIMNIYPNPFTSSTTVELTFANSGQVSVELWSMEGKLIKNIFSGSVENNTPYKYTIDGALMLPGIYFVRVVTNDHANVGKIELLR